MLVYLLGLQLLIPFPLCFQYYNEEFNDQLTEADNLLVNFLDIKTGKQHAFLFLFVLLTSI